LAAASFVRASTKAPASRNWSSRNSPLRVCTLEIIRLSPTLVCTVTHSIHQPITPSTTTCLRLVSCSHQRAISCVLVHEVTDTGRPVPCSIHMSLLGSSERARIYPTTRPSPSWSHRFDVRRSANLTINRARLDAMASTTCRTSPNTGRGCD
jgi:hypothetical protein